MSVAQRPLLLLFSWLGLLAVLALVASHRLEPSGDLRLFMPRAQTAEQRLLLDNLGEGPGSRLLLIAVSGAEPEALARHARDLASALADEPLLRGISTGEPDAAALEPSLLAYRYLLTPSLDAEPLDAPFLRAALRDRLQDLGSPAATLVEPWLGRDPSLEMLVLAERWQPAAGPQTLFDVWFDSRHSAALLLAQTAAGGFDPARQAATLQAIHDRFESVRSDPAVVLEISGPGAFSVLMGERTRNEATRLGIAAALGLVLLLALAYRSLRIPLLGALPLASGVLAGLAAVAGLFGNVHGITLAFGVTLVGVAQDYPVHLFSHHRGRQAGWTTAHALWPTLATGMVSTVLAYLSFLVSGVDGLRQLAVFAIAGLLTAGVCTRWLLPGLLPARPRDVADSAVVTALEVRLARLPRPRWLAAPVVMFALAVLWLSPAPLWDDDLTGLTPVPRDLLERDRELRAALGAPDVRYLLVVEGGDPQAILERSESLQHGLKALVDAGAVDAVESPSTYLPSARTQLRRRAALPAPEALAPMLERAREGLPFRADAFDLFLADVERARQSPPLQPGDLDGTALEGRLATLLQVRGEDPPVGLVSLAGVADLPALAAFASAAGDDVHLLDMRSASEALATGYRERVLVALLLALAALAATLWLALREPRRVLRVLSPVLLSTLLVTATLQGLGVALNLFHLVALILAAGLGLDYALFFERAAARLRERRRTLHAVLVCAASTGLVFGLLATSEIPVLHAIGLTVALGVAANLVLGALVAGAPREPA